MCRNSEVILEMKNISKGFSGIKALKDVKFKVKKGEIHGLVGENGAGKSTLMKILSGVYSYLEYEGDIIFKGNIQKFNSINDSEKAGIVIIYQELALVPEMSIYENIFLGHEIKSGFVVDWNKTIVKADEILKKVKLNISSQTKVKELGVGKKQLVEIAKAFSKNVELLILDEPTAALNEDDSQNLLKLLKEFKKEGVTSIIISHKLKEIISVADTVTVLRDGQTVCSLDPHKGEVTEANLIKNMVGRDIDDIYPKRKKSIFTEIAFETKNWTVFDYSKNKNILQDINIKVKKGEVVGIAGLMGAGRTEFAYSVFGNPKGYKISGELYINSKKQMFKKPKEAINTGLAYVTEDRKGEGLILSQDIKNNVTISNLTAVSKNGIINKNEEINIANQYKRLLNIKASGISQTAGSLSGGNQQKVSLGKWLFTRPEILILDEPTRGIDVGAKFEIYTIINDLVSQGMTIIIISSELPEILGMSDRIYVISEGILTGELDREQADSNKVMSLAVL